MPTCKVNICVMSLMIARKNDGMITIITWWLPSVTFGHSVLGNFYSHFSFQATGSWFTLKLWMSSHLSCLALVSRDFTDGHQIIVDTCCFSMPIPSWTRKWQSPWSPVFVRLKEFI
jgi:hypothetical protein